MTRLGRAERDVLDTLIGGGIAHNRSQSINWTIQAFGRGQRGWLGQIREATSSLSTIREQCMSISHLRGRCSARACGTK